MLLFLGSYYEFVYSPKVYKIITKKKKKLKNNLNLLLKKKKS